MEKSSVVVGGHLLGRDEKVKVPAKKNACSNADQNSCGNILRRTVMCEVLLHYAVFQQHTNRHARNQPLQINEWISVKLGLGLAMLLKVDSCCLLPSQSH